MGTLRRRTFIARSRLALGGLALGAGCRTASCSRGDDWHVFFGIDDGRMSTGEDCGRPSPASNYISNSLTVFNGDLYAASWNYDWTRVGIVRPGRPPYEVDFCHVYRYAGGTRWRDVGQPGQCRRLFGLASYSGSVNGIGAGSGNSPGSAGLLCSPQDR